MTALSVHHNHVFRSCVRTALMLLCVSRSQMAMLTSFWLFPVLLNGVSSKYARLKSWRKGSSGMIITSYSRLVFESHHASCAGLISGLTSRLPMRPARHVPANAGIGQTAAGVNNVQPFPLEPELKGRAVPTASGIRDAA